MAEVSILSFVTSPGLGQRVGSGPFSFLFGADTVLPLAAHIFLIHAMAILAIGAMAFAASRAERKSNGAGAPGHI